MIASSSRSMRGSHNTWMMKSMTRASKQEHERDRWQKADPLPAEQRWGWKVDAGRPTTYIVSECKVQSTSTFTSTYNNSMLIISTSTSTYNHPMLSTCTSTYNHIYPMLTTNWQAPCTYNNFYSMLQYYIRCYLTKYITWFRSYGTKYQVLGTTYQIRSLIRRYPWTKNQKLGVWCWWWTQYL